MAIELEYASALKPGEVRIEHSPDGVCVVAPAWSGWKLAWRMIPAALGTLVGLVASSFMLYRAMTHGAKWSFWAFALMCLAASILSGGLYCWRGLVRRNRPIIILASAEHLVLSTPPEDKVIRAAQIGSIRVKRRWFAYCFVVRVYPALLGVFPFRVRRFARPIDLLELDDQATAEAVGAALARWINVKGPTAGHGFEVIVREPERPHD